MESVLSIMAVHHNTPMIRIVHSPSELSRLMHSYDPVNPLYLGDLKKRDVTKRNKTVRQKRKADGSMVTIPSTTGFVTQEQFIQEMEKPDSRLCSDVSTLEKHRLSVIKQSNPHKCQVCDQKCYWKCMECGHFMHIMPDQKRNRSCFLRAHNPLYFGLCKGDATLLGIPKKEWCMPLESKRVQNELVVGQYHRTWMMEKLTAGSQSFPPLPPRADGASIPGETKNPTNNPTTSPATNNPNPHNNNDPNDNEPEK